jgi:hypothetical protein
MNKVQAIICGVLGMIVGASSPGYAQIDFCGIENRVIQHGEKLNFKVYYNLSAVWVGAGEANFTTTATTLKGKKVYHIIGDGQTYTSYDWIYKVRDKYETFIDQETLRPLQFIRNVSEGGYKIYNHVVFDHNNKKAYSDNKIFDVNSCIQDVLSSIYYARNIDYNKLNKGDKIPFTMFLDNASYDLYIRYLGKETITTKYGTFKAIKIAPLLIKGTIFKGGEKMAIWVSDDENHVPLRIDSPIAVGSIKVDLMGYTNLKNPLTALINKK